MKRPNLIILALEEEESHIKNLENIFNKNMKKNFPDWKKALLIKVQEPNRTPNRLDKKIKSLNHIEIKILNNVRKNTKRKVLLKTAR